MPQIHYDMTGEAGQLLSTLHAVETSLDRVDKEGGQAASAIADVGVKGKSAGGSLKGMGDILKSLGGRFGEMTEKLSNFTKGFESLGASGPIVVGIGGVAAAAGLLQVAIAKLVLASAEWVESMGDSLPLTEAQKAAILGTAEAVDTMGTQFKITGSRIAGEFASEVQTGTDAVNGLLLVFDGIVETGVSVAGSISWVAEQLSYLTPIGNAARESLEWLANSGAGATQALETTAAMTKLLAGETHQMKEEVDKETGSLDELVDAYEKAGKAARKAADDAIAAENDRLSRLRIDLREEAEERQQLRHFEEAELVQWDIDRMARLDAEQKVRLDHIAAVDAAQEKSAALQKQSIDYAINMYAQLAQQFFELAGNIAELSGDEKAAAVLGKIGAVALLVGGVIATIATEGGAAPVALAGMAAVNAAFPTGGVYQEYPSGGVSSRSASSQSQDHSLVGIQDGEAILNRATAARLGESGIDALNQGRAMGGGNGNSAIIYKHRVFDLFASDNIAAGGSLSRVLAATTNRGHRSKP